MATLCSLTRSCSPLGPSHVGREETKKTSLPPVKQTRDALSLRRLPPVADQSLPRSPRPLHPRQHPRATPTPTRPDSRHAPHPIHAPSPPHPAPPPIPDLERHVCTYLPTDPEGEAPLARRRKRAARVTPSSPGPLQIGRPKSPHRPQIPKVLRMTNRRCSVAPALEGTQMGGTRSRRGGGLSGAPPRGAMMT